MGNLETEDRVTMWKWYMRAKHTPREYLYRFPQTFQLLASGANRKKWFNRV